MQGKGWFQTMLANHRLTTSDGCMMITTVVIKYSQSQPNVMLCTIGCMRIIEYPKQIYEIHVFNDPIEQIRNMSFRECIPILELPRGLSGKGIHLPMQETQVHPWVKKIPCRRKWHPTAMFVPGKSRGQRSLAGYSPWGCKESDMTEHAHTAHSYIKS